MTTTEMQRIETPDAMLERVVVGGDLSKLTAADRLLYYRQVCESVGLNPLTRPFQYITLSGRLTLYAARDCTDQLRRLRGVSVTKLERETTEGIYVVTAYLTDKDGRTDSSVGAVPIEGLKGENRANAIMKAETKAKRRGTLSICGLGMLDETEVGSIPDGRVVDVDPETGEEPAPERTNAPVEAAADLFPTPEEELRKLKASVQAGWLVLGYDTDKQVKSLKMFTDASMLDDVSDPAALSDLLTWLRAEHKKAGKRGTV